MSIKKSFILSSSTPLTVNKAEGFSLIEVLIFVTILSIFLITSAAIITVSMRQNTLRINMLKATHYNEQLLEWIRNEKETDWGVFTQKGNTIGKIYCFVNDALSWPVAVVSKDDCESTLGVMYRRYVVLKTVGTPPSQVQATVYTEWKEAGNSFSTKLHTIFTLWEE